MTTLLLSLLLTFNIRVHSSARPNILLIFPDQWRFDWADDYYTKNLSLNTPTFKGVVTNGTRFVNTAVASPLCAPSRACIASGKEYDNAGVPNNNFDFPSNQETFYKLLQLNGYYTMVTGKDDLTKKTGCGINGTYRLNELGFNAQGRTKDKGEYINLCPNITDPFSLYLSNIYNIYNNKNVTEWYITCDCEQHTCCRGTGESGSHQCPNPIHVKDNDYEDNYITIKSLELLSNIPKSDSDVEKPWFLQINYAGPHPPNFILESMNKSINNKSFPYPMWSDLNANAMQTVRRDYSAEIENLDYQFSLIIDKIRDMKQLNNTIICISSDHGEMLGDYNNWDKSKPWIASSNVPLVCMGNDIKKGNIISTYVTNMDLTGTFLDYSNTTASNTSMTTISLRSFLNGTWNDINHNYRDYISSGLDNWRMVVEQINSTVTWKYVCCKGQCPGRTFNETNGFVELLFNIINDPYENTNIISLYPNISNTMKTLLPSNIINKGWCQNTHIHIV